MSDDLLHVIGLGVKFMRQSADIAKMETDTLQARVKQRDAAISELDKKVRDLQNRGTRAADLLRRHDHLTLAISLLIEDLENSAKRAKSPLARNALAETAAELTRIYNSRPGDAS